MEIKRIEQDFTVCQVKDYSLVNLDSEYSFIEKTDEEKSLVCITSEVPKNTIQRDDGWKAFRIQGVLDFSLIGILAKIATILADNGISIQLEEETKIIHVLCHIVSVYFLEVYQVTWHLSYLHYHLSLLFHNTST